MPKDISLTIDRVPVTVPEGTTILTAAGVAGIEIPHLCYDPALHLPPTSSCRLCLVEVKGAKALAASCSHPVSTGMEVSTDTEKVRQTRRMVVELLLSNHPHDCLTCERAGACELQRYAYQLGVKEPRFRGEPVSAEPVQDGPAIVYDKSKCILCARCVEVCHNVQVSGAIDYLGRGFDTRIALPPGQSRQESLCAECGNCIDVCPTGALSYAGAAGAGRRWETKQVPTICPYCGCGCTLVMNIRDNRIVEVTGREVPNVAQASRLCSAGTGQKPVLPDLGVNRGLLCVKGRFGFDFVAHKDRLRQPLVRRDGQLLPASWEEALDLVARRLTEIRLRHGPDAIGGLASAKCTNEENYVFQKFMRACVGTNNVDHCARLCHASTVTGLAMAFGSGAMTNSIEDFDLAGCIFVIGSNTTECHPVIGSAIKRAVRQRGIPLIVADPRKIELTQYAALHLRHQVGTDVALLNGLMHVILAEGLEDRDFISRRTEGFEELSKAVGPYTPELVEKITGVPAGDLAEAARMYAQAPAASIVYSMGITQHATGTDNVLSVANLALLTGNVGKPGAGVNPLRGQNNVQGACDMGALPNVYPGYQRVDDAAIRAKFEAAWGARLPPQPGLTVVEMINAAAEGHLKALYIMGENPMLSDPDITHVELALRKLELVVVQDIFLTETARLAEVVLPAASFAEKDGTFTNTERRVQLVRQGVQPPGEARTDWSILCDLARRMDRRDPKQEDGDYGDCKDCRDAAREKKKEKASNLRNLSNPLIPVRFFGSPRAGDRWTYDGPFFEKAILTEIASLTPSYAGISHQRLEKGSLQWPCPTSEHPGTPILHVGRFTRGLGKFHAVEFLPPRELPDQQYPFLLCTGRILEHFHTGTMSRRSEVLDKLVSVGTIEIHPADAARLGVGDGPFIKRVRVASRRGQIEIAARVTDRVLPGTVFLAFHYREAPANRLTIAALDPQAKIPEFKACAVTIESVGRAGLPA